MSEKIPEINLFNLPNMAEEEITAIKPVAVTVNNVVRLSPTVLYVSLAKEYDELSLPGEITGIDDMNTISSIISFCANNKVYLNSLSVYLDIATRIAKKKGKDGKAEYDDMVCKKNIVAGYTDTIDSISKAGSRMVTIFLEARRADMEENALAKAAVSQFAGGKRHEKG